MAGLRSKTRFALGAAVALTVVLAGCAHYEAKPLSAERTAAEFQARTLDQPDLKQYLEQRLGHPLPEWPGRSWDFPTLTLVAFYFHPSLDVARAQWAVAKAGIQTAGGRPNPILAATPGYTINPEFGLSPWIPAISLDIPIETAGKRGYRIAGAQQLSEAARWNIAATAWQVRAQLRTVLLDRVALQRRVELLGRQRDLEQRLVNLLEERLAAGAVATTEVTPARVALLKTTADLAEARRVLAGSQVQLADALGLPTTAAESCTLAPGPVLPTGTAEPFLVAEARDRALHSRPDLLAALTEYAASESALHLEIARQYPDLHFNPGYQFDQGQHKWTLGLSVELPVLNRNQGPIAEALARRDEVAARFLALQARVIAGIDLAVRNQAAVSEQLTTSEHLQQTQQAQASALQAMFAAGGADQYEVVSAQLEASVADLAVLDASNRAQQALGQLEDAFQLPFEALRSVEQDRRPGFSVEQTR